MYFVRQIAPAADIAIAPFEYRHLTPHDRTSAWRQRWKRNNRKKPKTRNEKTFPTIHNSLCSFPSTIVLCACRLPAASCALSKTNRKSTLNSDADMRNRRSHLACFVCIYINVRDALLHSHYIPISFNCSFAIAVCSHFICVSRRYSAAHLLSFAAVQIFSRKLTAPPAARSVPKLNWMIFVLRADNNNNLSGVVYRCLMHTNRKAATEMSLSETRCLRIRYDRSSQPYIVCSQRLMRPMEWIFQPNLGRAPEPRIIS